MCRPLDECPLFDVIPILVEVGSTDPPNSTGCWLRDSAAFGSHPLNQPNGPEDGPNRVLFSPSLIESCRGPVEEVLAPVVSLIVL